MYREVFESILYFTPPCGTTVRKYGCAAAVLGLIAWLLLRTSRHPLIGTFFSASSALIGVLAIVLTGKGIAALQTAGWLAVSVVPVPISNCWLSSRPGNTRWPNWPF